jgi:hypothetical protein
LGSLTAAVDALKCKEGSALHEGNLHCRKAATGGAPLLRDQVEGEPAPRIQLFCQVEIEEIE